MRALSEVRRAGIVRLFRAGWSYYAIHRETGHGVNTVKRICLAAGLPSHTNGYRSPWLRGPRYTAHPTP